MKRAVVAVLALGSVGALGWAFWPAPGATLQPADVPLPNALVAHDVAGLVDVPLDARSLAAVLLPLGQKGSEPTIGVARDGAIYVTGGEAKVLKSADRGATWRDVSDSTKPRIDLDPHLHLDPRTDRVYSAPLYRACTNLMWTDDGGRTWDGNPTAGCPLMGHDHQSVTTGPFPEGLVPVAYPNVVYYAYNSDRGDGAVVSRSLDGGRTWSTGTPVFPSDCQGGLAGRPATAPDGTVILPKPGCQGIRIGVSKNAGETWDRHDVNDTGIGGGSAVPLPLGVPYFPNPGAAFDAAGNGYVLYTGKDGLLYLTRSTDGGDSWSAPVRATPPGVNSTAFSAIVGGAGGRVALAYLGTEANVTNWTAPYPHYAPANATWHLYVAYSANAASENPTFTTLRATPLDDPVQVGCIWQAGGESDCRNLREYIDITQRGGRAYVAYTDGCRKCNASAESRFADLHVAVLDAGPSLVAPTALARYR